MMKACNECHVYLANQDSDFCPLCGSPLEEKALPAGSNVPTPNNRYPDLHGATAQYNLVKRLLVFFSLLGGSVSLLVNLLVPTGFLWSLVAIAAILYLWLSIPPLLRRGINFAKRIVFQVLFTSALVVAMDIIIGYNGWSVSYVVPALLCAGIVGIWVMIIFNRTSWAQYVLYQFIMGIFGLIPLLLWGLEIGRAHV